MKSTKLFKYHFLEFIYRVLYTILGFIFTFFIGSISYEEILYILSSPLAKSKLKANFIYTEVSEILVASINIGFLLGIFIIGPLFIIHLWLYLIPLITNYWRNQITIHFKCIIIINILAILFTYYVIIPISWEFFFQLEFYSDLLSIRLEPKINEYIFTCSYYFFFLFFYF